MLLTALGLVLLAAITIDFARPAVGDEDAMARARQRMVAEQLSGPGRGLTNARVLAAMGKVPRHEFVPRDLRGAAYDDRPCRSVMARRSPSPTSSRS